MIEFEWDGDKAARNLLDQKVSFEQAAVACADPNAMSWLDERWTYGEERFCLLGLYGREVLYVAYTERGSRFRLISARRAERSEQHRYYRQEAP